MKTRIADDFDAINKHLKKNGVIKEVKQEIIVKELGDTLSVTTGTLRSMTLIKDGTNQKFRLFQDMDGTYRFREIE